MNRPLLAALFMSLLLAIYLVFALNYAWILITDDSVLANAMGYALGLLPLLGVWGMVVELRFGRSSALLARQLESEGGLPTEFSLTASGRADRESADALFPSFAQAVKESPDRWQAWMRLGMAYDACGDRRRARWAIRRADWLVPGNKLVPDNSRDGVLNSGIGKLKAKFF